MNEYTIVYLPDAKVQTICRFATIFAEKIAYIVKNHFLELRFSNKCTNFGTVLLTAQIE
jgi:hypothetical protein